MTRRHKRLLRRMKRRIRKIPEYAIWVQLVLKSHDKKCAACRNNKHLQAHHIYRFSKIIMENNITSVKRAYNCKKLWDVSNGVALCQTCHKLVHSNKHFEFNILTYLANNNK